MAQGCGVGSTGRRGAAVQVARDATGEGWLQLGSGTAGDGRCLRKHYGHCTNEAEDHPIFDSVRLKSSTDSASL
jgi:hypothetical protein